MKMGVFKRVVSTHWFVLKTVFGISKKRVFFEFLYCALDLMQWLVIQMFLFRVLFDMAERRLAFSRVMLYLWGVIAVFLAVSAVSHYFQDIVLPVTDVKLYEGIHQKLYQKACQVDLYCFEDSEFYNQYMMAIRQAQVQFPKVFSGICRIVCGFAAALVGVGLIFMTDPYAVLFLIFPLIGNFVFNRVLIQRVFQMEREIVAFQRISDYVNRTVHLAEYAKEIRLTNVFRLLKRQYDRSVESTHRTVERYAAKNVALYGLSQMFTFTLLIELSMIYASYRVLVSGTMTFAQMAVFQNVICSNTWLILDFTEDLMAGVHNSLGVEQIQGFLTYEPRIPEDSDGELPELPVFSIEFVHVWFGYREGHDILKDVSFRIAPGQSVAVAGYNGAGKSTLVKLLLRFYDPDRGVILLNGTDIRNYQLRAYRALFTAAFQDGKIFADTVRENVLMGRRSTAEADKRTVWRALELAGIADEVKSWPNREYTVLTREFSREGRMLSGGQCQKIIAARAFAKDSSVAVFDEPSSALDPIAEYRLFEHIQSFGAGKMLFFISHRLSSVQNADVVLFMENGRITERGSHRELMRADGSYAKLYRCQAKNYQTVVGGEDEKR